LGFPYLFIIRLFPFLPRNDGWVVVKENDPLFPRVPYLFSPAIDFDGGILVEYKIPTVNGVLYNSLDGSNLPNGAHLGTDPTGIELIGDPLKTPAFIVVPIKNLFNYLRFFFIDH